MGPISRRGGFLLSSLKLLADPRQLLKTWNHLWSGSSSRNRRILLKWDSLEIYRAVARNRFRSLSRLWEQEWNQRRDRVSSILSRHLPRTTRPWSSRPPVLPKKDLDQLRVSLQKQLGLWEEEAKTSGRDQQSFRLTFDPEDPGSLPDPRMVEMSQALDKDALKLKSSRLTAKGNPLSSSSTSSNLNNIFSTSSRALSETLSSVTDYVPRLPFYLSNAAAKVLAKNEKDTTDTTGKKKNPSSSADDAVVDVNIPRWRQKRPVTKATVDARTRFCVESLYQTPAADDTTSLRKMELLCSHLHQYPWAKGVAVRMNAIGELLLIRSRTENQAVHMQTREALDLLGVHDPLPNRGIRILCLDGGGMRGIVALEVLRALEVKTGKRIYELFDFICGVSTGAIIAAFLSFHKQSVAEVEKAYKDLGTEIFTQNLLKGASGWVRSHAYYDSQAYEKILQGFVGEMRMSDTLRNGDTPKVAMISTLVSEDKIGPYVFRNYHYPYRSQSFYKGSARHPIWAAVRASSAAPGYFDEFYLKDKIHHDGGMMSNNATMIAIHESQRLWPNDPLECVVSLGMGRHVKPITYEDLPHEDLTTKKVTKAPKALSLAQKFARVIDAATDTEVTHCTLHDLLPGNVYYRFNPALSEYYPMDEVRPHKMKQMREDTLMYNRRNDERIGECADQLQLRRHPHVIFKDCAKVGLEVTKAKLYNNLLPMWSRDQ